MIDTNMARLFTLLVLLVICTVYDLRERRIPDWLNLCGVVLAVIINGWQTAILGCLVYFFWAYAMLSLIELVLNKEFYGGGDIKMMAMAGAFLGWDTSLIFVPLSIAAGLLTLLILSVFKDKMVIPFAPVFALTVILSIGGL